MERKALAQLLFWMALLIALAGAAGAYRFFQTVPELQAPQDASWWQLVPYGIIIMLIIALLLDKSTDKTGKS